MPRKSRELRLTQTQQLISDYEQAGLGNDRNCLFAKDMERMIRNNRGLSPKRRQWLDSLIEEGVPEPQNEKEVAAILAAANLKGMERRKNILIDFAGKLRRGWSLSEKQRTWLDNMLAEAKQIEEHGIWEPDAELKKKMEIAILIGKSKNGYYWNHRPGTAKSHDRVASWLADPENVRIDEWACNKLLKNYRKVFEELESPKHAEGELRYYSGSAALIAGHPFVNDRGNLVYPAIVDGQFVELRTDSIGKRAPKKKS